MVFHKKVRTALKEQIKTILLHACGIFSNISTMLSLLYKIVFAIRSENCNYSSIYRQETKPVPFARKALLQRIGPTHLVGAKALS